MQPTIRPLVDRKSQTMKIHYYNDPISIRGAVFTDQTCQLIDILNIHCTDVANQVRTQHRANLIHHFFIYFLACAFLLDAKSNCTFDSYFKNINVCVCFVIVRKWNFRLLCLFSQSCTECIYIFSIAMLSDRLSWPKQTHWKNAIVIEIYFLFAQIGNCQSLALFPALSIIRRLFS